MALIVEDGSVVANANSFIDLTDARANAATRGLELSSDDTIAEQQLVMGYEWLVMTYEDRLKGSRVAKEQTGIYPRSGVYAHGFAIGSDEIPQDIINAQVSGAASINDGMDTNAIKTEGDLKSFNAINGLYSETYKDNSSTPILPVTPALTRTLKPYLKQGGRVRCDRENLNYINASSYGWY